MTRSFDNPLERELRPSTVRMLEMQRAIEEKGKRKPKEKMRSFGHLSQEILERIAELVDAQATTSRELGAWSTNT